MAEVEREAVCWNRSIGLYLGADMNRLRVSEDSENDRPTPKPIRAVPGIGLAHGQKPWKPSPDGSGEAIRSIIHRFSVSSDPITKGGDEATGDSTSAPTNQRCTDWILVRPTPVMERMKTSSAR